MGLKDLLPSFLLLGKLSHVVDGQHVCRLTNIVYAFPRNALNYKAAGNLEAKVIAMMLALKTIFLLLPFAVLLTTSLLYGGDFEDGWAAFQRGDSRTGIALWSKAAERGDAVAQNNLGVLYKKGEVVPQDFRQAVFWYRKAAEQGDGHAQYNLGVAYVAGYGVARDHQQGVFWYRKAAEQGLDRAQNNLGYMYANGQGVLRDYVEAYKWYELALVNATHDEARETAKKNRDDLARRMTPTQVAEAQKRAREWQKKASEPGYSSRPAS